MAASSLCGWCVLMVTAAGLCYGSVHSGRQLQVVCDANDPCRVPYKGTAALLKPVTNHTDGVWRRMPRGNTVPNATSDPIICDYFVCSLSRSVQLTNQDTGIYYYNYTDNGSSQKYEYVNVTILAPPSLTSVMECDGPDDQNCYPATIFVSVHPLVLTVSWDGLDPVDVSWTHNGTEFICNSGSRCESSRKNNSITLTVSLYSVNDPSKIMSQCGMYAANVSNQYGWNMSTTAAKFECPPLGGVQNYSSNKHVEQFTGERFEFQCELQIGSGASLFLCYADSSSVLSNQTECIQCISDADHCWIPANYSWINISTNYINCFHRAFMVFAIDSLTEDNSGTFYCGWQNGAQPSAKYYTNVTLSVTSRPPLSSTAKLSMTIAIPLGSAVFLLVAVIAGLCFKVRRRDRDRQPPVDQARRIRVIQRANAEQRIEEGHRDIPNVQASPPPPPPLPSPRRPGYRTVNYDSDEETATDYASMFTDNERQPLFQCNGSDYNTMEV